LSGLVCRRGLGEETSPRFFCHSQSRALLRTILRSPSEPAASILPPSLALLQAFEVALGALSIADGVEELLDGRMEPAPSPGVRIHLLFTLKASDTLSCMDEGLLTGRELAGIWKVSPVSISLWQRTRGLPVVEVGRLRRYRLSAATRWLEEGGPRQHRPAAHDHAAK